MDGHRRRSSFVVRLAASPTTSSNRTSARLSLLSVSRSPRFFPLAMAMASRAWSSICRSRTEPSRCDILVLGRPQGVVAEIVAEEARGIQVYLAPQNLRELFLHPKEGKARHEARFEFDQNIHVA